jgi:hypothetical protein
MIDEQMPKLDVGPFGWLELEGIDDDEGLFRVAKQLGAIVPQDGKLITKLRPLTSDQAKSRSFSHFVAYGAFPLHTDTAFWPTPVRYLILRAVTETKTPTLVLGAPLVDEIFGSAVATRSIFAIKTCKSISFGGPYLDLSSSAIRFDPCYMKPVNAAASSLCQSLRQAAQTASQIQWTGTNALVIDNWRCLHGRAAIEASDPNRCLTRIYVGEAHDLG